MGHHIGLCTFSATPVEELTAPTHACAGSESASRVSRARRTTCSSSWASGEDYLAAGKRWPEASC
eukprot:168411-Pyramimonas_sp.AAC.1